VSFVWVPSCVGMASLWEMGLCEELVGSLRCRDDKIEVRIVLIGLC
jgi:hypothetical protein